jgi:hypothetical protein
MIYPHTELQFISKEIGYGVVATEFIPAGTVTWVLDKLDREFTEEDFLSLEPIYQNILDTYTFRNNKGNYILCWDNGRFVNHSFNSNCLTTAYDFEIAIRDIQPGEQLTDDYGYLNITHAFKAMDEGTKRKVVYPNDLPKYYKQWDNQIKKVFHKIPELEQPLGSLLSKGLWNTIHEVTNGVKEMESILNNYYDSTKPNGK